MILAATAAAALSAFAPVVVHDSGGALPARLGGGARADRAGRRARAAVYGRAVPARAGGTWLQYWLYFPYQDQDRGIVRTGRHEGDWELVQYRVVGDDRLVEAVYAQHSGAERCGAGSVERRGGRPVVYAAHGSHASYFRAGTRDRLWPDPNDEADGRGRVVRAAGSSRSARRRRRGCAFPGPGATRGPSLACRRSRTHHAARRSSPSAGTPTRSRRARAPARPRATQVGECDAPEKAITVAAVALPLALLAALWRRRRR